MADMRSNTGAQMKQSFAEAAARLNGLVQSVKAHQTGECRGTHCVNEYAISSHSPDEVWAKNFATYGIGPEFDTRPFQASPLPQMSRRAAASDAPAQEPAKTVVREPMAVTFQKPRREKPSIWRTIMFGNRA